MRTKEQFIIEVWESMEEEVVGASQLRLIEAALFERFESALSPASIARVLADHGTRLGHPEILQADTLWREKQSFFTSEDLELTNIDAAIRLMDRVQYLWRQFEQDVTMRERLRHEVRSLKTELDSLAPGRQLAAEVAQWLSVWLQNPAIFAEWLTLRQNTPEYRNRFLA